MVFSLGEAAAPDQDDEQLVQPASIHRDAGWGRAGGGAGGRGGLERNVEVVMRPAGPAFPLAAYPVAFF